eukprot:m.471002 g.471002  ORF g.471002 m.471002 type:complete len:50 (-) comp20373_c0_seq1:997-1146(-)
MLTQTNLTQSSSVHAAKTSLVAAFTVMLKQTVRGSLFSVAKDLDSVDAP